MDFIRLFLKKSFYIHWSAGRSPWVQEVNPGRDPSTSFQDHGFSPSGLATFRSLATIIRHELVTPSSALLALHVSSPCPNINGGINLFAVGSSD